MKSAKNRKNMILINSTGNLEKIVVENFNTNECTGQFFKSKEIVKVLKSTNPNKAIGTDSFNSNILKDD